MVKECLAFKIWRMCDGKHRSLMKISRKLEQLKFLPLNDDLLDLTYIIDEHINTAYEFSYYHQLRVIDYLKRASSYMRQLERHNRILLLLDK